MGGRRRKEGFDWSVLLIMMVTVTHCLADLYPCDNTKLDTVSPCGPCKKEKFEFMASDEPVQPSTSATCQQRRFFRSGETCAQRVIVEPPQTSCFNRDPVARPIPTDIPEAIAPETVLLDPFKSSIGFTIPEALFFRYFAPPDKRTSPEEIAKFDIGQVSKYYIAEDKPPRKKFDTDFELFEWPGRTASQYKGFLEEISKGLYGCVDNKNYTVGGNLKCSEPHDFVMLAYDKPTTKFLNYPCNILRGTQIVAYGRVLELTRTESENLKQKDYIPSQRFYLTHGSASIHQTYIQPLYVRSVTVRELSNDGKEKRDPRELCDMGATQDEWHIVRTILDFTFATDRLVLGMHCGVLIVDRLQDPIIVVYPAKFLNEKNKLTYSPKKISLVSSSVCCGTKEECSKETRIVAAYSRDVSRVPGDLMPIYISFDEGDTFEIKHIAPRESLINLIQSMYRIYDRWDFYYKMLEDDSVHSKYSDSPVLKNMKKEFVDKYSKKHAVWDALNPEDKEVFVRSFAKGTSKAEIWKAGTEDLTDIACTKFKEFINHPDIVGDKQGSPPSPGVEKGVWYPDTDYTPAWVRDSIAERYKEFVEPNLNDQTTWNKTRWNQAYCETLGPACTDNFEEDKLVKELTEPYKLAGLVGFASCAINSEEKWKERTKTYTRKQNPHEIYCLDIASILVLQKEQSLLMLCRVGYCEAKNNKVDCTVAPTGQGGSSTKPIKYAIFKALLRPKVVIISPFRKSGRIFQCKALKIRLPNRVTRANRRVNPVLLSVPKSSSLIITHCEQVIFFSPNGGRTWMNAIFYFKKTDTNVTPPKIEYKRSKYFSELQAPTSTAIDPQGHTILITVNNYYMFGVFNSNREFRLIVGTFVDRPGTGTWGANVHTEENIGVPYYTNSGTPSVSLITIEILRKQEEYKQYFKDRPAIRFTEIPISFYSDMKPFFTENLNVYPDIQHKLYSDCNTYAFSNHPTSMEMDIGDSTTIQVKVIDENPKLPIGIYANDERGMNVMVEPIFGHASRSASTIQHIWNVTFTSVGFLRSKEESHIDAFFGSEYINVLKRSPNVILLNLPSMRCHVQPSGSVSTTIGCLGKTLIAHEDEYREQCKFTFVNNFNYTLEKGQYDPELARYWIENNPEFVHRDENGDLQIVYDFSRFGCPIEPYQEDDFAPDLRILDESSRRNSTMGRKFNGSYVLIEMFGATEGYKYTWNVKRAGCTRRPQNHKRMLREWIIRRRIFNITRGRMQTWFPNATASKSSAGSLIFDDTGVNEHINIWNRVNYQSCYDGSEAMTDEEKEEDYEIMNNADYNEGGVYESINRLKLSQKKRPKVLMFLAIAVDNDGTFCNYYTMFGVSLPKSEELDDFWSFICFVIFVCFWVFLVIVGYYYRKERIRRQYIEEARAERLKQSAWTIIYRYEKLLQDSENKQLEAEMLEHAQAMDQEEREAVEQRKRDSRDKKKGKKDKTKSNR